MHDPVSSGCMRGQPLILLVEDDPTLRDLIAEVLSEERPYQVLTAHSGSEALRVAEGKHLHLLLTDYSLVGGMDGIALYDALRALKNHTTTRALVMSASLPCEALQLRQIPGLQKPFELDDLLGHVDRLVNAMPACVS